MHNTRLVSVLIPTYNVEKYIKLAMDSILNQTYKNLEVIVVDDDSSDNTYNILKEISQQDCRVKIYKNKKNLKICKTLNRAFKESKGEYIIRMDGDDLCSPERIEKQIEYLENNKNIDLVGMSVNNIDENGNIFSRTKYYEDFGKLKKLLKYGTAVLHIWAARREVYEKLNGYREIPYVEDYDFLLRMITHGYKFSNLEDYYGYSVRFRSGNTATTRGIEQIKAFDYVWNLYKERVKNNLLDDNFDESEFKKKIKVTKKEKEKYDISINNLQKYFELKKIKKNEAYIYLLKSFFSSKFQMIRLQKRLLFKLQQKFWELL